MRWRSQNFFIIAVAVAFLAPSACATWFDAAWPYRRAITVEWQADRPADESDGVANETAVVDFYTAGHAMANGAKGGASGAGKAGADIRVATSDGHLCSARVLKIGPDDNARVLFELKRPEKNYYVYWGNADPAPLPANVGDDVPIAYGVLFETRGLNGRGGGDFHQLESAWKNGKPNYGGDMIARPFIGYNPCTNAEQTVDRLTASLFAPADGDYEFAGACDDCGALYLDGKPVLYIPGCYADTRFNKTISLTRGRHEFLMYHINYAGPMIISLGWKTPGSPKVQIIGPETFGICHRGEVGALEEIKQNLVPDFTVEHVAETFEHEPGAHDPERGNYSQLYRFKAILPHDNPSIKVSWNFGDGQTAGGDAAGAEAGERREGGNEGGHGDSRAESLGGGLLQDHVFLTEGIYPVALTYKLGETVQTQTNRILVQRDESQGNRPQTNDPPVQSRIVARYDVQTMPVDWLPWAAVLHFKANDFPAMTAVADRLASEPKHPNPALAFATLSEITEGNSPAADASAVDAIEIWKHVPVRSDLQTRSVKVLVELLLWAQADFDGAADALAPFENRRDVGLNRRRATALLLAGKVDDARRLFATLRNDEPADRAAAIDGAMARSVEYYITEKDVQAGEDAWEQWQNRFPQGFLEGYSALLRVKLMNLAHHPAAAAKVAEAFANAVPTSSYTPQLLDEASKLLAKSDPAKSAQLRALLKQRYPEDPLSNK